MQLGKFINFFGFGIISDTGIGCWNPAFDVTPAELITGIITEKGVFKPAELCDRVKEIIASTNT